MEDPRPVPRAMPPEVRIVAKTLAKQMLRSGYEERDVIALATELIGLVSASLAARQRAA